MIYKTILASTFIAALCVVSPRTNARAQDQNSEEPQRRRVTIGVEAEVVPVQDAQVQGQWGDDTPEEAAQQAATGNGGGIPPTEFSPPDREPAPGHEMVINPPEGQPAEADGGDGSGGDTQSAPPLNAPVNPFQ